MSGPTKRSSSPLDRSIARSIVSDYLSCLSVLSIRLSVCLSVCLICPGLSWPVYQVCLSVYLSVCLNLFWPGLAWPVCLCVEHTRGLLVSEVGCGWSNYLPTSLPAYLNPCGAQIKKLANREKEKEREREREIRETREQIVELLYFFSCLLTQKRGAQFLKSTLPHHDVVLFFSLSLALTCIPVVKSSHTT